MPKYATCLRAAMRRRILADTNVLIDIALPGRPQHAEGLLLLDEVAYGAADLCVASSSLKDVYYILTKCASEADARTYIQHALDAFTVIPVDEHICRIAAHSDEPDFEDGIIRACAETGGVEFILSRDEGAFRTSAVRRLSTREYLELFCGMRELEVPEGLLEQLGAGGRPDAT